MTDEQEFRQDCEAAFDLLMRRYGNRLSSEMVDGLRGSVEAVVRTVRTLRSIKLQNGDAPLVGFAHVREEG